MAIIRQALGSEKLVNEISLVCTVKDILEDILKDREIDNKDKNEIARYIEEYGNYYAWGGASEKGNYEVYWKELELGDLIFFGRGKEISYVGRYEKRPSKPDTSLANLLWDSKIWSYIYFMSDVINLEDSPIRVEDFNYVANYSENAFFRGISRLKSGVSNDEFLLKLLLKNADNPMKGNQL